MADEDTQTDRAYPYWAGWGVVGCAIVFFGLVGSVGVSLIPAGCDRVRTGDLPTGIAMVVLGVFGVPTLAMSFLSLAGGIRDTVRPPLLRVTTTALVLPIEARGDPLQDEYGEPIGDEPPHPETVPFTAIRWIRRVGPDRNQKLEIAHDLSEQKLLIDQYKMRSGDFDDLEIVLRAALPAAFLNAPPEEVK